MGLDGTIKRDDGQPLGDIETVQSALALAFPGVQLGMLPSGPDKIRAAAEKGIQFPEILRKHLESAPATYGGEYEGPDFSAQFSLGSSRNVEQADLALYGNTTAAEPMLEVLKKKYGWITTHP
jgi:hypothetical protein